MKKKIFFSVVMPVYNKESHVARAIKSVLNQTHDKFELLIVCDPSTDNSNKEVEKFNDSRIRIFHRDKPGPGGYAARNLGINESNAEWISFLDADDEWYENHLEKNAKVINKYSDIGFITSAWESIYNDKTFTRKYYYESKDKGDHKFDLVDYLNCNINNKRLCQTSIVTVKKNNIKRINGFPAGKTKKGGDLITWIKLIKNNKSIWSQNIGAKVYRDSENMVTNNNYFNPDYFLNEYNNLQESLTKLEVELLRIYINNLIVKDLLKRKANNVETFNLNKYTVSNNLIDKLKFNFINLIPGITLRIIKSTNLHLLLNKIFR